MGRRFDEIERTTLTTVTLDGLPGRLGESPDEVVDRFGRLAEAGAQHVILGLTDVSDPDTLARFLTTVLLQVHRLDPAAPSMAA